MLHVTCLLEKQINDYWMTQIKTRTWYTYLILFFIFFISTPFAISDIINNPKNKLHYIYVAGAGWCCCCCYYCAKPSPWYIHLRAYIFIQVKYRAATRWWYKQQQGAAAKMWKMGK